MHKRLKRQPKKKREDSQEAINLLLRNLGLEGPFPAPDEVKDELIKCIASSPRDFPEIEEYGWFFTLFNIMDESTYRELVIDA